VLVSPLIMVIDDEPDLMNMIVMYLKLWKFRVEGYTDPLEALESFRQNPSTYSLILTDIRMPYMNGIELACKILAIRSDVKVVIMTAYESNAESLAENLPMLKHNDILKKPFRLAEICQSVKKQLQTA
jgi:CheY-like chemotaxis protein